MSPYKSFIIFILCVCSVSACAAKGISHFLELPKDKWVLESKNAFVIEDKFPKAPVHLLIIPKTLVKTTLDASPSLMGEMLDLAKQAATKYGVDESGFRIAINTNPEGGQHIYHLHIHLLGGRQMNWPPG